MYRERPLDDPALSAARQAVELILKSHEPYPALAVDRHWNLLAANAMLPHLMAGADPALLQGPVNVLRLSLHPQGPGAADRQPGPVAQPPVRAPAPADPRHRRRALAALLEELRAYPGARGRRRHRTWTANCWAWPCPSSSARSSGVLSFISTTTVFGTPIDVTLQELALETFFPADAMTGDVLEADARA